MALLDPADGAQLAGLREQRVARLQFGNILSAANDLRVEIVRVGHRAHQEVTAAQCPLLLVELGGDAVGEPEPVGGIIEGAGRPDRPVHEILAGVLGVGIAVKDIAHRELAGLQRQPVDVDLARELLLSAGKLLLLAAESEGLAHEQPRGVVVRVGEVRLLRLAAGKSGETDGVAQAEPLQQFGIVIDLAAFPEPGVQIKAVAPGGLCLTCAASGCWCRYRARGIPGSPAPDRWSGREFPSDRIRDRSDRSSASSSLIPASRPCG